MNIIKKYKNWINKWPQGIIAKFLPLYLRLWPTYYWIAVWTAPDHSLNQTNRQALRITIRYGECHEIIVKVIKKGIVHGA